MPPLSDPAQLGRLVRRDGGWGMEWVLKRNCSMSPRQLVAVIGSLCTLSLGIAGFFWVLGAPMVMPFAWVEVIALMLAVWLYARHAADRERIELSAGCLRIERRVGTRLECVEFTPAWVRIGPRHGSGDLVLLSGQGRSVAIGRHLRPELRPRLAEELRIALRREPALQWQAEAAATSLIESLKLK
ncbi:DUF2244 domain-containing protein [Aquabacterium sp. A7-Y]|uniref:DUF2244 domain-containing protein n=1 Tax=Aquabacterium sp. A7-Y TaxID=1349605 RepID=UPI00223E7DCB|nr:DUF2244 domain-containing protein [Aquabacterium sp. A7-Y]MCW7537420.1 DUF2244 domain-containing protein [Aquabacterium sp. A7-Y]